MVETADRKQQLINKQAIIIVDLKANLEQAALALEVRDATFTELRKNLLKAAAEANRTTGLHQPRKMTLQVEGRTRQDIQPIWPSGQEKDKD